MNANIVNLILKALFETIHMTFFSTIFAVLIGFPIGVILYSTKNNLLFPNIFVNKILDFIVNIFRSFPFVILMILLFPLSRLIVKTSIGPTAAIVPLSILSAPFVARLVANSFLDIDQGIIDSSTILGLSRFKIITKVLIPESLPQLFDSLSITVINIIGASAMAGALGGGGLGDLAIRYGLHRFEFDILVVSVITIIILVQTVQVFGDLSSFLLRKKRGILK